MSCSCGIDTTCHGSPSGVKKMSMEELISQLSDQINEKRANRKNKQVAIERALGELNLSPAFEFCVNLDLSSRSCENPLPCCGMENMKLQVNLGCDTCWKDLEIFKINCGKLVIPNPFSGEARAIVSVYNEIVENAETVSQVKKLDCGVEIYVKGQPDFPPSGFLRVGCQDFFYTCRAGKEFEDNGIAGEEITEDLEEAGRTRVCGVHTTIFAHPVDDCGRIIEWSSVESIPAGSVVEFLVAFQDPGYLNALLSSAVENVLLALMDGCANDRDLTRYQNLLKIYQGRSQKLRSMQRRTKRKGIRYSNDFRGLYEGAPLSGWHSSNARLHNPRIGGGW